MGRFFNREGTLSSYNISSDEILVDDRFGYKIVAIVRNDCWSAYRGSTDWTDSEIGHRGDVIPENIATYLFPSVAYDRMYEESQ